MFLLLNFELIILNWIQGFFEQSNKCNMCVIDISMKFQLFTSDITKKLGEKFSIPSKIDTTVALMTLSMNYLYEVVSTTLIPQLLIFYFVFVILLSFRTNLFKIT